jgi:N utilization substance protein B
MLSRRSRAREVALQLLCQRDTNPAVPRDRLETFLRDWLHDPISQPFCQSLYDGVVTHLEVIDGQLTAAAENWRLPRMAVVDRNVLRLGAYELLFSTETPPKAVLDEAIELARRFGGADSPSFVNGVLDKIYQTRNSEPGTRNEAEWGDGID